MSDTFRLPTKPFTPSQALSAPTSYQKPQTGSLALRKLGTPMSIACSQEGEVKNGKRGKLQKYLGLTATSLQIRDKLGTAISQMKPNSSQSQLSNTRSQLSLIQNDKKKLVYPNIQGSQFYQTPLSNAVPLQQTFQMFLPNKIKKDHKFKHTQDIKRPKTEQQGKFNNLKEVLNQIMPASVQHYNNRCMVNDIQGTHIPADNTNEYQLQSLDSRPNFMEGLSIKMLNGKQLLELQQQDQIKNEINRDKQEEEEETNIPLGIITDNQHNRRTLSKNQRRGVSNIVLPTSPTSSEQTTKRNKLYIGNRLNSERNRKEDMHSTISPYGDQHNLNDMFYSGGFLLKSKSKMQQYIHNRKESNTNFKKGTDNEKQIMIQVKSLDQIIKSRQSQLQKVISNKKDEESNNSKVQAESDSIKKDRTIRFIKQLQIKPPSSHNYKQQRHSQIQVQTHISPLGSPMHKHIVDSIENSPTQIYTNPIQKVLITHKDQNEAIVSNFNDFANHQRRYHQLNSKFNKNPSRSLLKVKSQSIGIALNNNDLIHMIDDSNGGREHTAKEIKWNDSITLSKQTLDLMKSMKNLNHEDFSHPTNYDLYIFKKQWKGSTLKFQKQKGNNKVQKHSVLEDQLTGW